MNVITSSHGRWIKEGKQEGAIQIQSRDLWLKRDREDRYTTYVPRPTTNYNMSSLRTRSPQSDKKVKILEHDDDEYKGGSSMLMEQNNQYGYRKAFLLFVALVFAFMVGSTFEHHQQRVPGAVRSSVKFNKKQLRRQKHARKVERKQLKKEVKRQRKVEKKERRKEEKRERNPDKAERQEIKLQQRKERKERREIERIEKQEKKEDKKVRKEERKERRKEEKKEKRDSTKHAKAVDSNGKDKKTLINKITYKADRQAVKPKTVDKAEKTKSDKTKSGLLRKVADKVTTKHSDKSAKKETKEKKDEKKKESDHDKPMKNIEEGNSRSKTGPSSTTEKKQAKAEEETKDLYNVINIK